MGGISAEAAASLATTTTGEKSTSNPFALVRKTETATPTGPVMKFDRNRFMDSSSGQVALERGDRRQIEGVVSPDTKVELSAVVVSGYRDFARDHTQKLIDLVNAGRYEAMKAQQATGQVAYLEDNELLRLFSETAANGTLLQVKSQQEVADIIAKHPYMIQNLAVIGERVARDNLAALGMRAYMDRPGTRTRIEDAQRVIDLPVGQGRVTEAYSRVVEWANARQEQGGRVGDHTNLQDLGIRLNSRTSRGVLATSMATGLLFGGPGGAAVGGALAGAGLFVGSRLTKEGPSIHIVRDQSVLDRAQQPEEQARMEGIIKVDPNHPERTTREQLAEGEAIKLIYLRALYMKDLKVDPSNLDAFSDQFIDNNWGPDGAQTPEKTDTKMQAAINEQFNTLGGPMAATPEDARIIFRRAEEIVFMEQFRLIHEESKPAVDTAKLLTGKLVEMQPGGAVDKARKREAAEEKTLLGKDKAGVEVTRVAVESMAGKIKTLVDADTVLNDELAKIVGPAGALDYINAVAALNEMLSTTVAAGASVRVENADGVPVEIRAIPAEEEAAKADARAAIAAIPPQGTMTTMQYDRFLQKAETDINDRLTAKLEEFKVQRKLIGDTLTKLRAAQKATTETRPVIESGEVIKGAQELVKIQDAFDRVTTAGFTEAHLLAFNFDQEMADANLLNSMNPDLGWPESDNEIMRPDLRSAIIQARANNRERTSVPNATVVETNFNTARALNFTLEELSILTSDELVILSTSRTPAGTTRMTRPQLIRAQLWAREKVRYTQEAIRQENTNIESAERVQDVNLARVDMKEEREQLEMVIDVVKHKQQIEARANNAWIDREVRTSLEDVNPVTVVANSYTPAEVASGLPRNVLEIINILTDYQNKSDRNGAFSQIWRNFGSVPNGILLERLNSAFEFTPAIGPGIPDINVFAAEIQNRENTSPTFSMELGRALGRNAVREFGQWGESLSRI